MVACAVAVLVVAGLNPPVGFPAFGLLAVRYTVAWLPLRTTSLPAAGTTAIAR
jgi:hypothetical protein